MLPNILQSTGRLPQQDYLAPNFSPFSGWNNAGHIDSQNGEMASLWAGRSRKAGPQSVGMWLGEHIHPFLDFCGQGLPQDLVAKVGLEHH